jgi:NADH-quinone oxidoreductase subunit G/NADP-reducing hydrogenase subunit HndD
MEAALRSVYELLTKESLSNIDFKDVRGTKGHKEAIVNINGTPIKVAVAHGLKNASVILDEIRRGKSDYAFVEIMACPGGCIGGGGQPINIDPKINEKRIDAIYEVDKNMEIRKSHENPAIKELYEDFLGEPLGELSHKLLHTHYHSRF